MTIKAIILIGGPNKGQRFRPLSFDSPKYMFPVGGQTILGHLVESCLKLHQLTEIILLGFYQQNDMLSPAHLQRLVQEINSKKQSTDQSVNKQTDRIPNVRYLQEFTRMGTAGGLYHFRDQIKHGDPEAFLLINGDVCGDFDFDSMLAQHQDIVAKALAEGRHKPLITVMTTEASRPESLNYGCIVEDIDTRLVTHYVEKPSTFVSNLINCGAYVCSTDLLGLLEDCMRRKRQDIDPSILGPYDLNLSSKEMDAHPDYLSLELDVLQRRYSKPFIYSYRTKGSWWCQVKTATSAIYANRQYLAQYNRSDIYNRVININSEQNTKHSCTKIGNVFIHPTAHIDPSSVIGPNVSIMENCIIGPGVRVKESIILQNSVVNAHTLVSCSIVGWNCTIGSWTRVEGTPSEPDPNQKFAKVQNPSLFNTNGKLNPLISVLGSNVKISSGTVILDTIVLPHKELARSYKNEIVL